MLLPHEVLHAFAHSSKFLFDSVVLGQLDSEARIRFWAHVSELEPWKHHPIIRQERGSWEKLIGVCAHGDGAQMYKEDEFFVWSLSSVFGGNGLVKDVLMYKWPIAIIPERHMQDPSVSWFSYFENLCLLSQIVGT